MTCTSYTPMRICFQPVIAQRLKLFPAERGGLRLSAESARARMWWEGAGPQVADIADVVRQRADALMLSGESAIGAYPEKALGVLRQVSTRIEEWVRHALFHPFLTLACTRGV